VYFAPGSHHANKALSDPAISNDGDSHSAARVQFVSAWNEGYGVMTESQRDLFPSLTLSGKIRQCVQKTSKAWGRVHPHRLFSTIVVRVYPMDARMGTCIHWDQQRMITVMEARRAQSFPDHEVLVGSSADKWKVIGNSVSRTVSLALGLSLRNAWLKCPLGDEPRMARTTTTLNLPSTQSNNIREKKGVPVPPILSISALRKRLSDALDKQIARQNGFEDTETGGADDQDDADDAVLNSAIAKLEKRFPRIDTPLSTGSVKTLNKEGPKRRLVIELDSFFESDRSTGSDSTGQLRILPPPRKYIHTSGGKIAANAQTNGLVHRAVNNWA
jgi:hypothetical protein